MRKLVLGFFESNVRNSNAQILLVHCCCFLEASAGMGIRMWEKWLNNCSMRTAHSSGENSWFCELRVKKNCELMRLRLRCLSLSET